MDQSVINALHKKFKLVPNEKILVVNGPEDFDTKLSLADGVAMHTREAVQGFNQIHWFVQNKAEFELGLSSIMANLPSAGILWIYYPKKTSKIQTDLTRDKGWDMLFTYAITWITLVSFDDTWSAFAIKNIPSIKPQYVETRECINLYEPWIDMNKKIINLPPFFEEVLSQDPQSFAYYQSLAYTHRKEYLVWILSAKTEETNTRRLEKMMEMLRLKRKNPNDKG